MQEESTISGQIAGTDQASYTYQSFQPPYRASWIDLFNEWVDRLSGPNWMYYMVVWVALSAVLIITKWIDGIYPVGTIYPFHLVYTGLPIYNLGMLHYLDTVARGALKQYRPVLALDDAQYAELQYKFTTMPAGGTFLSSLISLLIAVTLMIFYPASDLKEANLIATTELTTRIDYPIFLLLWLINGPLVYHSVRQLYLVNLIYTRWSRINLFQIGPLYAFARLSGFTAAGWAISNFLWMGTISNGLTNPANLSTSMFFQAIAAGVFILPLLGVHRLLQEHKQQFLNEIGQRLQVAFHELNRSIDAGEFAALDGHNKVINSLNLEQTMIQRVPTWPWQPEVPRLVITTVCLPFILWLITRFLERMI